MDLFQTAFAILTGSVLLAFISGVFSFELSRITEAVFEAVEYRLALREHTRTAYARYAAQVIHPFIGKRFRASLVATKARTAMSKLTLHIR